MRSEGYTVVGLSVCPSVTFNLTSRMCFRLTNHTKYLTGNEGQKFVANFLQRLRWRDMP